jgi:hypothetical protein
MADTAVRWMLGEVGSGEVYPLNFGGAVEPLGS